MDCSLCNVIDSETLASGEDRKGGMKDKEPGRINVLCAQAVQFSRHVILNKCSLSALFLPLLSISWLARIGLV
jgi:hypothetical protein